MSDEKSNGKRPKVSRKKRLSDTWITREHKRVLDQEDWFDTGCPGLILRISYGGARTFRVRYKDENGKSRTHKLGRWDPKKFNVETARKAAKKFDPEKDLKTTRLTASMSEDQVWWATATVEQVIERYITEVVSSFRTKKETERCFRTYVIPELGKKVFVTLKKSDAGMLRRNMRCVFRKNGTVISLTDGQQFH